MPKKSLACEAAQMLAKPKGMKDWYRPSVECRIAGFEAVRHRISGETAIVGKWGEIWEIGGGVYGVLVKHPAASRKTAEICKMPVKTCPRGSEAVYRVSGAEIGPTLPVLKIPAWPGRQATLANRAYAPPAAR